MNKQELLIPKMLWIIGRCQIKSGKLQFTNNEVPVMRGKLPSHDQETHWGEGRMGDGGGGGGKK